jgi:hypothetical protein
MEVRSVVVIDVILGILGGIVGLVVGLLGGVIGLVVGALGLALGLTLVVLVSVFILAPLALIFGLVI